MDQKNNTNNTNNESYSKSTILIILILFMFSTKLFDIVWDIGKGLLFIIVITYCLNFLNPNIASNIKEIINNLINFDTNNNIFKNILSKISSNLLNVFKKEKEIVKSETVEEEKKYKKIQRHSDNTNNTEVSNLRTLDNKQNTIGRKLA